MTNTERSFERAILRSFTAQGISTWSNGGDYFASTGSCLCGQCEASDVVNISEIARDIDREISASSLRIREAA